MTFVIVSEAAQLHHPVSMIARNGLTLAFARRNHQVGLVNFFAVNNHRYRQTPAFRFSILACACNTFIRDARLSFLTLCIIHHSASDNNRSRCRDFWTLGSRRLTTKCLVCRNIFTLLCMTSDGRTVKLLSWISCVPKSLQKTLAFPRTRSLFSPVGTSSNMVPTEISLRFPIRIMVSTSTPLSYWYFRADTTVLVYDPDRQPVDLCHRHEYMSCNTTARITRWRLFSSTRRRRCILTAALIRCNGATFTLPR